MTDRAEQVFDALTAEWLLCTQCTPSSEWWSKVLDNDHSYPVNPHRLLGETQGYYADSGTYDAQCLVCGYIRLFRRNS
jgi:hypothetical protein